MRSAAIILERPGSLRVGPVSLKSVEARDVVVDVEWSGISSGTERLLWSGQMPAFPGMGYPLVPGYETVGQVSGRGPDASLPIGSRVFVPGSKSFSDVRSLFGGAASRLIVDESRCVLLSGGDGEQATLLALAATAHHIAPVGLPQPELIVGHGALGRLLARLVILSGAPPPVVWEQDSRRKAGAVGYEVVDPAEDDRRDYKSVCDVSGSSEILDSLVQRLAPGGEVVLAGFYNKPVSFAFAPAFMREVRVRVAAQWQPADLTSVAAMVAEGRLSLDGIITHRAFASAAADAYAQAFEDLDCLKMCLDWRSFS